MGRLRSRHRNVTTPPLGVRPLIFFGQIAGPTQRRLSSIYEISLAFIQQHSIGIGNSKLKAFPDPMRQQGKAFYGRRSRDRPKLRSEAAVGKAAKPRKH
jgi:hypothetical protein